MLRKTKGPAGGWQSPSQSVGRHRKGRGVLNSTVSFLNLLGVFGSNRDKGGNDYSVKSMALDYANAN